jgi:hypothetical protein
MRVDPLSKEPQKTGGSEDVGSLLGAHAARGAHAAHGRGARTDLSPVARPTATRLRRGWRLLVRARGGVPAAVTPACAVSVDTGHISQVRGQSTINGRPPSRREVEIVASSRRGTGRAHGVAYGAVRQLERPSLPASAQADPAAYLVSGAAPLSRGASAPPLAAFATGLAATARRATTVGSGETSRPGED